jgi:hypothetical protein
MADSLLGGKAGGVEQLLGGLLGNSAAPCGTSQSALWPRHHRVLVVSIGANAPVSAAQLERALGGTAVTQAAAQAGVDPAQAMGGLAAMLPRLIDKLTPDGDVTPGSNAMLTQVMGMLPGK